ncbi:MAG TPA: DNA topoisomerase IB [Acidimicrobiia bacterium]|nr:DNA topoisomerase IB [Acidimicrobiia bacterium]
MSRLRRADPSLPGYTRRRAGRGFVYLDETGERIVDPDVLARIRALVIPPAWKDVWICPWPNGHLQAVGIDARGRRQYRYHDRWRARRDAEKFDRMAAFALCLPKVRRRCAALLAGDEPSRERVLACAIRLLDLGFFRIGGEEYVDQNGSYGLATLRKEHARLEDGNAVTFDYPAKSGKRRMQTIVDEDVFAVVAALKRRRTGGPVLFAFRSNGRWVDLHSSDINDFVKELTGGEFTAKDFRTWAGTVLAAVALAVAERARSRTGRRRAISRAYQEVAHYLGNTPAVCRKSYVDPRVVDRYRAGVTIADALTGAGDDRDSSGCAIHGAIETAVLELLDDAPRPGRSAAGAPPVPARRRQAA